MKNKNTLIAVGIVVAVLVGLFAFSFLSNNNASKQDDKQTADTTVQTIKPEDIGFKMETTPDKKKVKFSIAKAQGIKALEYQINYEADSTAQEKSEGGEDRVQRGITGEEKNISGNTTYESDELDLGSCSKNVCKYDTGVKTVAITLKITKTDDKVYNMQDSLEL